MADPFLEMLVAPRPIILGRTLYPLSAFHVAALALLNSPFSRGGVPQPSDIISAVHVCASQWDSQEGWRLDVVEADVVAWGESVAEPDWNQASADLQAYAAHYLEGLPEVYHDKDSKPKPSGMPWPVLYVTAVLIHMPGITEAMAWNMPVNRLAAYRAAIAENNGYQIVSERDRELFRLAKIEDERWQAEQRAIAAAAGAAANV